MFLHPNLRCRNSGVTVVVTLWGPLTMIFHPFGQKSGIESGRYFLPLSWVKERETWSLYAEHQRE